MGYQNQSNEQIYILIVDDDEVNISIMETLLQTEGYLIVSAINTTEALDILADTNVHIGLIILDVQLKENSGFELLGKIKQNKKTKNIPIIFISGHFTSKEDILYGISLGAADYLTKPLELELLKLKVKIYFDLYTHIYKKEEKIAGLETQMSEIQKNFQKKIHDFDEKRQSLVMKLAEATIKKANLEQTHSKLIIDYAKLEKEKRMLLAQYHNIESDKSENKTENR